MKIDLNGKAILVTGSSRGIGEGIARHLAKSGARIAVHYNTNKEKAMLLSTELGNDSAAFCANLENPQQCEKLFNDVLADFGKIDVLINNAGIFENSSISDPDWIEKWDRTMAVNLRAVGILSKMAISHFKERGVGGQLIHISSRAAFRGDGPDFISYAASKAGVVALSKTIARGYGKDGIVSFVIAPGWVESDMSRKYIEKYGEENIIEELALNSITQPKEIASIVTLLASGLADHATGTTIHVNAGSYVH
jgi:NAD(P)-dependent dehydrogenase (short-subunit alcohol dehydrogenase family)